MSAALSLFAPAKVNLFLHIIARLPNGYHELESLIVFVDVGDCLSVSEGPSVSLGIEGPFASLLAHEPLTSNLVHRAADNLKAKAGIAGGAHIVLDKNLPVASGIGGGSADAAAALRLLKAYWKTDLPDKEMEALGLDLGADIPVCFHSKPMFVSGIGEYLAPAPALPDSWMLLVNSGTPVPTGPVFKGLDPAKMAGKPGPVVAPDDFADLGRFVTALRRTRNDLEPSALQVAPDIADVLETIAAQDGCLLSRMSGSGGTCFGLFAEEAQARLAAETIKSVRPKWWAEAGRLLQAAPDVIKGDA